MSSRHRLAVAGLLSVLGLFTVGWNLGGPPVTDLMEVRNLVTAREMADTGRWLIPTMNDALRLAKPPLPTWAAAVAGMGAGFRSLWALRAPTVLVALLGAVCVVLYARRLGASPRHAAAAGLVLLSTFLYARHARLATWDVPTHVFAMAALTAYAAAAERRSPVLAAVAGLMLAASSLSKGPMGAVMVVPWAISAAIWQPSLVRARRREVLVFLAVGGAGCLLWPLYVYSQVPGPALAVAIQESEGWVTRHVHPPWFYAGFPMLAGAWAPAAMAVLLSPVWFRSFLAKREVRSTFGWLLMSLIVLMVVPTKKERYLIPALFPLAILIAQWWESEGRRATRAAARALRAQTWFAGTAGVLAPMAVVALLLTGTATGARAAMAVSLTTLGLAGFVAIWRTSRSRPAKVFAGTLCVAAGIMSAGWHLQARLEPKALPAAGLEDSGRVGGALDEPCFAHEPDDLYLVWQVGRPLQAFPASAAQIVQTASAYARGAATPNTPETIAIEACWISLEPPGTDSALQKLKAQQVGVTVRATGSGEGIDGGSRLYWSRVRFEIPRPSAVPGPSPAVSR